MEQKRVSKFSMKHTTVKNETNLPRVLFHCKDSHLFSDLVWCQRSIQRNWRRRREVQLTWLSRDDSFLIRESSSSLWSSWLPSYPYHPAVAPLSFVLKNLICNWESLCDFSGAWKGAIWSWAYQKSLHYRVPRRYPQVSELSLTPSPPSHVRRKKSSRRWAGEGWEKSNITSHTNDLDKSVLI